MIVVDANVIAALLLETEESRHVEQALRRDPEWAAPFLWRSELRNVLASLVREAGIAMLTFDRQILESFPDLATTPAAFASGN